MLHNTVDSRLAVKREFANQDDIGSQRRFKVLDTVIRNHSEFSLTVLRRAQRFRSQRFQSWNRFTRG